MHVVQGVRKYDVMSGGERREEDAGRTRPWETYVPKAVTYQCIWLVRDMERLLQLEKMNNYVPADDEVVYYRDGQLRSARTEVADRASHVLACMRKALDRIPEEYRSGIIANMAHGEEFDIIASVNTWKKWKKTFIREFAAEMDMI